MKKSDIAISVRDLSKSYVISHQASGGRTSFREALTARLRNPFAQSPKETFWALKDVSFDVKKGDVLGIIGRNGAGKSTLLKILSRITKPTSGQIDVFGRVGSLLEVGTGFHPELTGRENVYLNGTILGMRRSEVRKQFDAIVDFAGVEQFIDTPVKRYSSGMYVRLAFAVAAHLRTEILIVDEVLAVGDAQFQKKCLGKMKDMSGDGRTVLFVSHNLNAVLSLCTSALLMVGGKVAAAGDVDATLDHYVSEMKSASSFDLTSHAGRSRGSKPVLRRIEFVNANGEAVDGVRPGEVLTINFDLESDSPIHDPRLSVGVNSARGERLFAVATFLSKDGLQRFVGHLQARVTFCLPSVVPGQYSLDIGLSDGPSTFIDAVYSAGAFDVLDDNYLGASTPHFSEMGPIMVRSTWAAERSIA